ncbi:MAG: glycogen synthase, partial [Bacteroidia bacterium]|nr:glycogen synthase [Bacteroidia bacterium]
KAIIDWADAVVKGSPKINSDIEKYIKKSGKPYLDYKNTDEYVDAYSEFYDAVLEEVAEMVD